MNPWYIIYRIGEKRGIDMRNTKAEAEFHQAELISDLDPLRPDDNVCVITHDELMTLLLDYSYL